MNKIVIVGHPLSGYQEVQNLLNACGMAVAQPSRREGFMPEQISATLCKVHATPALSQLDSAENIQQIEAGPVWHGMALDLMLGNLEQPLWGWADPQAIYLLNYWRDLDPSITFILVYDRPHSMLTQAGADEALGLSAETLAARTRNWAAYNAALLHFFHRNPQRCLLVHSQQVRESAASYLQQVRARIHAPWSERMQELAAPDALPNGNHATDEPLSEPVPGQTAWVTGHQLVPHSPAASPQNALTLFLAEALLQQHPASLQLYQELQAVANLPLAGGTDVVVNERSALDAWLAMAASDQRLTQTETLVQQKQQLIERLSQTQAQAEQLAQDRQRIIDEQTRLHQSQSEANQRRLDELHREQQTLQQAQQSSQQENDLLLAQLHQVQEELERHYLESQQQKAAIQTLQQAEKLAAERAINITQLSQEKTKLLAEKDTQAKLAAERAAHAEQLKKQLAAQTQLATEKATQLSQQAEQLKKQLAEKEQNAKTQQQQAEQLKKQLADKERQAQAQAAQLQTQLTAAQAQAAAAPVVDPALAEENELLLTQLHQVQEELERYYLQGQAQSQQLATLSQAAEHASTRQQELDKLQAELQALKAAPPAPALGPVNEQLLTQLFKAQEEQERQFHGKALAPPALADLKPADRVRQQLSYRLGSTMIERSRSVTGWLSMPVALVKTTRQYRRDLLATAGHPKPPPASPHDKQMAEAVKQHLSYKLGATLIKHARTPVGWVKLPFALRREVKDFKKRQHG